MSQSTGFYKKTSGLIASVLIGFIILSFMLSGYYGRTGSQFSNIVAKVGDQNITIQEYQREFAQRLAMFKQFMGGKELSRKEIEQFGLKQLVLNSIIDKKLLAYLADEISISSSHEKLGDEIKKLPYFQTNKQFDVNLYKNLLKANGINPNDFEEQISQELKVQQAQEFLRAYPLSKNYLNKVVQLKSDERKVQAIEIKSEALKLSIKFSNDEVQSYLAKNGNLEKVKAHFEERKESLNTPETVKARHILLMAKDDDNNDEVEKKINEIKKEVTTKNFVELANKYTEDPSGKGKGGDLGKFSRGRMVPEFEEVAFSLRPGEISSPVKTSFGYHIIYVESKKEAKLATFDHFKSQMALELMQQEDKDKTKQLEEKIVAQAKTYLAQNNQDKLKTLSKKYHLLLTKISSINQLSDRIESINLDAKDMDIIFDQKNTSKNSILPLERPGSKILLSIAPTPAQNSDPSEQSKKITQEKNTQTSKLSNDLIQKVLEHLKEKIKITTYSNIQL